MTFFNLPLLLKADRDAQLTVRDNLEKDLRRQIEDLSGRLEVLSDSESQITSHMDRYNKRLMRMEDAINRKAHPREVWLLMNLPKLLCNNCLLSKKIP